MYNPHLDRAYDMFESVMDKHKDELMTLTLDFEEMLCSNGDVQIVPFVRAEFKF